ncbi:ANTAR domain-containing protein [Streptomyces sp. NPDC102467]|uniref:ANTAR domain-containing protein n=1 Tax=Streptomyces sp. NPDC102467 TaxID=3366179 RepID=UPI0037F2D18A
MRDLSAEKGLANLVLEVMSQLLDESVEEQLSLQRVAQRSAEQLGVRGAGVLLAGPADGLAVVAATSPSIQALQQLAVASGQGPEPVCFQRGEPMLVTDLPAARGQWPQYAGEADGAGVGAVSSLPLPHQGNDRLLGVMNLFYAWPGPIGEAQLMAAQTLADALALALGQRRKREAVRRENGQLRQALSSRVVIEQAKGALAARLEITLDEAFARLRTHARSRQQKLTALSAQIARGHVPADLLPSRQSSDPGPRSSGPGRQSACWRPGPEEKNGSPAST